ncbi:hypothetical protein llap_970 [Limosa lapponica baueri]|uniref:Uncharacterized protein n=1 Tax=Limosa lapponica baueri TaxID=1758121 RepID=A0A2I0URJ0_LIMLA|nr:hypothetical protein llap_970 [Limosa lapponica baueri]
MEFEIKMDFDLYTGIISYNMTSHFKHRIQPWYGKKHSPRAFEEFWLFYWCDGSSESESPIATVRRQEASLQWSLVHGMVPSALQSLLCPARAAPAGQQVCRSSDLVWKRPPLTSSACQDKEWPCVPMHTSVLKGRLPSGLREKLNSCGKNILRSDHTLSRAPSGIEKIGGVVMTMEDQGPSEEVLSGLTILEEKNSDLIGIQNCDAEALELFI